MPSRHRSSTLFDVMLLIGAVAIGFALLDLTWPAFWPLYGHDWPVTGSTIPARIDSLARHAVGAAPPVLSALTLGILAVGIKGPKPRLRRLSRQPGMAACLATLPALGMLAAAYAWINTTPGRSLEFWYAMVLLSYLAGPAVAGTWILLGLERRWRSPMNWANRLGVAVGACWIATTMLALYSLRR